MLSKNQLKKSEKRRRQALDTVRAIEHIHHEIQSLTNNPKLMEKKLQQLLSFIYKFAGEKDTSNFKCLIALSSYHQFITNDREEKVKREIANNHMRNATWRDFKELIKLRSLERKSNEQIASEIRNRGVACNRESIRLYLKKIAKE